MKIVLSKSKAMQIQKEVELYLQTCGKPHMGVDSFRVIQPGDICWLLVYRHWPTFTEFLQTITLNGNFLVLELWQDGSDKGDEPVAREFLSINTDLKALQIALASIAERCCWEYIESLVVADYWKTDFDKTIARLSHTKKIKAKPTIESFESKMRDFKMRIKAKDNLSLVITLCDQLDEDCEIVNQLYYDK